MMAFSDLPAVNAGLNTLATLLLLSGYRFIKQGNRKAHQFSMLGALTASTLFLASYLTYHYQVGSRPFTGEGLLRSLYFAILISHTVLAMLAAPMVVATVAWAIRRRFSRHRRIASWTFPIWLYVSVTGVTIYWMLYRMYT